jgi:hypothetical protein
MDELSENVIDLPQNQTNRERTPSISHQTGGSALLEEYLNVQGGRKIRSHFYFYFIDFHSFVGLLNYSSFFSPNIFL